MLTQIIKSQKNTISQLVEPIEIRRSEIDFYSIFKSPAKKYILECKKSSPSRGSMTKTSALDLALQYAPFADVLSVLTNSEFFDGTFNDLAAVSLYTGKPTLCKDIIVDPIQIKIARAHGAHAVLLMLSVLNDSEYLACQAMAHNFGMGVITEVITPEEVARAVHLDAKLIAINNRNLFSLKEDLETTEKLSALIPDQIPVISASGITTHLDIQRLSPYADAFLIGSTLSLADNKALKIRELLYGHVKVCGLTRHEDAQAAYDLGATMGGLNFIPQSARYVTTEMASKIKVDIPLKWFGVFANESIDDIVNQSEMLNLEAVLIYQIHSNTFYEALRDKLPAHCEIWQTVTVNTLFDCPEITGYVLDSPKESLYWEKGQPFDWELIQANRPLKPYLLAGGIAPENILNAIAFKPDGFSINSGVESMPGIKDAKKMQQLFKTLREQR